VLEHSHYSVVKRFTSLCSLLEVVDWRASNPHCQDYCYILLLCGKFLKGTSCMCFPRTYSFD
jgi:hypothetical protein